VKRRESAARTAVAMIAIGALALPLAGCEPLSAGELKREVGSIASVAAEGSTLADQIASQRTKRTFARVQARELSDQAEHNAERLSDAEPAEGLGDDTDRAIALAEDVSAQIGELELAPDDPSGAADAATRLRELADQAGRLAGSL
jgi:hypothetical protein